MTIKQLIERLQECGDEKFKDTAEVRILNMGGHLLADNLDIFDVKDGVKSVDIYIPADIYVPAQPNQLEDDEDDETIE